MKKESLLRGVFNYSISSWINIIIGFFSVAITTRIIAPDEYGIITIFLSTSSFVMYILTFGMDGAFIRFYNDPPTGNTRNQVLYRIVSYTTIICCLLSVLLIGPLYRIASGYIFGIESRSLVIVLMLYTYSQAIFRYLNICFRMGFRTKEYTIQNILINCATRVIIIVAGLLTKNVYYIIWAMGAGMFIMLCTYAFIQRKEITPIDNCKMRDYSISIKGYKEFLRFALFSAPSYFIVYFNGLMSQMIIKSVLNPYALGVFASCATFKTIFSALQGGFSTYWSAYVYKNYDTDKQRIADMHDYVLLFALFCASGLVIGRDIVYLIIGKEYHASKSFFSLLLIASVLSLIRETTDKGLAIAKKNEITLIANLISVVVNLVGCFFLTSRFGIKGAAYADAIAAIVLYVIISFFGQRYYRSINKAGKSMFVTFLILVVMLAPSITENLLYIVLVSTVAICIAVLVMFKEFKTMVKHTTAFMIKFFTK